MKSPTSYPGEDRSQYRVRPFDYETNATRTIALEGSLFETTVTLESR